MMDMKKLLIFPLICAVFLLNACQTTSDWDTSSGTQVYGKISAGYEAGHSTTK